MDFDDILKLNTFENTIKYSNYSFGGSQPIGTAPKDIVVILSVEEDKGIYLGSYNGSVAIMNISTDGLVNVNVSIHLEDYLGATVYDGYFEEDDSKGF